MKIEILEDGSGIAILDNKCWRCNSKDNITKHHAIPQCLNPKMNVIIPVCEDCHNKINEIDLQSISKFLYKITRHLDNIVFFIRFKKWKKEEGVPWLKV